MVFIAKVNDFLRLYKGNLIGFPYSVTKTT